MAYLSHDDLLSRIRSIRVHSLRGRPSPHKPLLLLLAIGRHLNGHPRLATFSELEEDVNRLIRRFGLPHSKENAQFPFWRLQNDGLWEVVTPARVRTTTSGDGYLSDLRKYSIKGGLAQDFINVLDTNTELAWHLVQFLLNNYFPPSLHDDIVGDVGLVGKVGPRALIVAESKRQWRDRGFRDLVIRAYKSRCALCKLDIQVDGQPIGIEAAHIKWHCANGPAQVENGMALCALHHKFFDSGLFTVLSDLTVHVGSMAEGDSADNALNKYGGSVLPIVPENPEHRPSPRYLEWHRQAVFRSDA